MQIKLKKSLDKNKIILDIVNLETKKFGKTEEINTLYIDENSIIEHQEIANAFNEYF
jgi:hypothetical protein